jgi:hypothetical protein
VVRDNQSIIVFNHCHSVDDGTWKPLGAGHFLSDSVTQVDPFVMLIPLQATMSADITSLVISIPSQAVYVFQAAFQLVPSYTINTLLVVS